LLTILASDEWRKTHSGAQIGCLEISGVDNSNPAPVLESQKRAIEQNLRERYAGFSRSDLLEIPVMAAYHRYYRKFGYSYHVLLQLESLVHKEKSLPDVSPLVDANFAAELDTHILTAGHDVALLEEPLVIDVAHEGDGFIQMSGQPKNIPAGDMVMKDAQGIICSILRGQDNRSPITPETTHVLYVSYVPDGVMADQVLAQLHATERLVSLFAPECNVLQSVLLTA
jgi:DNA/RNA-binding domain of Phe-tRNA-synthetase-like protein